MPLDRWDADRSARLDTRLLHPFAPPPLGFAHASPIGARGLAAVVVPCLAGFPKSKHSCGVLVSNKHERMKGSASVRIPTFRPKQRSIAITGNFPVILGMKFVNYSIGRDNPSAGLSRVGTSHALSVPLDAQSSQPPSAWSIQPSMMPMSRARTSTNAWVSNCTVSIS